MSNYQGRDQQEGQDAAGKFAGAGVRGDGGDVADTERVGCRENEDKPAYDEKWNGSAYRENRRTELCETGPGRGDVSDAESELRNGAEQLRDEAGVAGFADGMRRDAEPGLGGVVDGVPAWMDRYWVTEPDIPRLTTKKEHRVERLRALGNAVYWRQFYPIFRGIMEVMQNDK